MVKRVVQEAPIEYVTEKLMGYDFFEETLRNMLEEIARNCLANEANSSKN